MYRVYGMLRYKNLTRADNRVNQGSNLATADKHVAEHSKAEHWGIK